jgi:hypothetical protein
MNIIKIAYLILSAFLLVALCSCYEGSSRKSHTPDGGGVNPKVALRPYYIILFEPIVLSQASMNSVNCFQGSESERIYRFNEWTSRINLMRKGLEQLSETFVFNPIFINPEDCKKFEAIEKRAVTALGLANATLPTKPDANNRISLHIKAVFWDHDNYLAYPSSAVRAVDWKDVTNLRLIQIRAMSLHYMLISNRQWGFFEYWRSNLPSSTLNMPNGIANPDPGENGIALRDQQIQKDTLDFFEWIKGAAFDQASVGQ